VTRLKSIDRYDGKKGCTNDKWCKVEKKNLVFQLPANPRGLRVTPGEGIVERGGEVAKVPLITALYSGERKTCKLCEKRRIRVGKILIGGLSAGSKWR